MVHGFQEPIAVVIRTDDSRKEAPGTWGHKNVTLDPHLKAFVPSECSQIICEVQTTPGEGEGGAERRVRCLGMSWAVQVTKSDITMELEHPLAKSLH